jgi:hypothetical protein
VPTDAIQKELNVRWATEDPNPRAQLDNTNEARDDFAEKLFEKYPDVENYDEDGYRRWYGAVAQAEAENGESDDVVSTTKQAQRQAYTDYQPAGENVTGSGGLLSAATLNMIKSSGVSIGGGAGKAANPANGNSLATLAGYGSDDDDE